MNGSINIIHQNIQCVRNKILELEIFIESLEEIPDLVCLTEHWLSKEEEHFFKIEHYHVVSCCSRVTSVHGGSCILVRDTLQDFEDVPFIKDMSVECEIEISCIMSKIRKLVVMSIYRTGLGNLSTFMTTFEEVLDAVHCNFANYDVVVCGDFNINLLNDDCSKAEFLDLLTSFNYEQTIFKPTRITETTKSLIDNIFINTTKFRNNKNLISALTDHMGQHITVETLTPIEKNVKEIIEKRFFTKSKLQDFFYSLQECTWDNVMLQMNPNRAYEHFFDTLKSRINQIFPLKKCNLKKGLKRMWITSGIKKSSKHKRDLYEKMLDGLISQEFYKKYSNILKQVVRQSKKNAEMTFIANSENKTTATWTLINKTTKNERDKDKSLFKVFPEKSEEDLLNEMNAFFLKSAPRPDMSNKTDTETVRPIDSSIFLGPVLEEEMLGYIRRLKNKKTVGYDEIPVDLLKTCASILVKPLTHIINRILQGGEYPQALKEALVKPIHKKGNKNIYDNYRPISILSNINKIFERIIFDKVLHFFDINNILVKQQCGFRQGKSTINAMYQALNSIIKSLNKNQVTSALCLDLTKAFDSVNHNILLEKMEKYGIRGVALDLFRSYLTRRTQRTTERGKNGKQVISDPLHVERGVPQGSILGPLLYIIYTNDLIHVTSNDMVMFADDVSMILSRKTVTECKDQLECDLKNLEEWFKRNELVINIDKTKLLVFRERNKDAISLTYHGKTIKTEDAVPFLGIYIDRDLSWKTQIENLSTSIARYCYALRILTNTISEEAALTAYYAYVQSKLRYGIIFWGNSVEVERIFIMQKRCLRTIFKMKYNESCRNIFIGNNLLTLYSLFIYECVMYVSNNFNDFKELLLSHEYNTRGKNYLSREKTNFSYIQRNAVYFIITVWNKFPQNFKCMPIAIQRKRLKMFLVSKCYYSVKDFLSERDFVSL